MKTNTEKLIEILNPKIDKILDSNQVNLLFKQILESEYQKEKNLIILKNRLEELISTTRSGELRNELTEINILFNL